MYPTVAAAFDKGERSGGATGFNAANRMRVCVRASGNALVQVDFYTSMLRFPHLTFETRKGHSWYSLATSINNDRLRQGESSNIPLYILLVMKPQPPCAPSSSIHEAMGIDQRPQRTLSPNSHRHQWVQEEVGSHQLSRRILLIHWRRASASAATRGQRTDLESMDLAWNISSFLKTSCRSNIVP